VDIYAPFDSKLQFEFVDDMWSSRRLGRFRVRVIHEVTCYVNGLHITIPAGFVTDFASTPRAVWFMYPPWGLWAEPAVVHDRLYVTGVCSREDADKILKSLMQRMGIGSFTCNIFYAGVRVGGWRAWNRYRRCEDLSTYYNTKEQYKL